MRLSGRFLIGLELLCGLVFAAGLIWSPASAQPPSIAAVAPALAALAPDTLVVVGRDAPAAERQAAARIADALRACGGPADNLIDDVNGMHNLDKLIEHHLILVGTYDDNDVLHQQWGHWAQDRVRSAAEPSAPDTTPSGPWYLGAPTTGFGVMGYGTFKSAGVGYIETDRNAFYLIPQVLHLADSTPYRIKINITGSDSAGVVRAARAFLSTGCVGGVMPPAGEALPIVGDALTLSRSQLSLAFPEWLPHEHLVGWIMADSTLYAGFLEASSKPASAIWIAKYNGSGTITGFDDVPHRMSTTNELFVARTDSAAEAGGALAGLLKTLDGTKTATSASVIGGHSAFTGKGFIAATSGAWVVMCTVPDPLGSELMDYALEHAP